MRISLAALAVIPLLATSTTAQDAKSDDLLDTLDTWAHRAKAELKVEGAPDVHRVSLASFDGHFYTLGSRIP